MQEHEDYVLVESTAPLPTEPIVVMDGGELNVTDEQRVAMLEYGDTLRQPWVQ